MRVGTALVIALLGAGAHGQAADKHISYDELNEFIHRHRAHINARYNTSSLTRRAQVDAPLYSYSDSTWAVDVDMGDPAKTLRVAVDTGSSDLWVYANAFGDSHSKHDLHRAFFLPYTKGNVSGSLVQDRVAMDTHVSPHQILALVDHENGTHLAPGVQGVMGFGDMSTAAMQAKPFWQSANVSAPIFALYLRRGLSGTPHKNGSLPAGTLSMGAPNASLYQGEINYAPVASPKWWALPMHTINVSNHTVPVSKDSLALIDSGTSLIGGPAEDVRALYQHIAGAEEIKENPGYFSYPCSVQPNVSFTFGNRQYVMNNADFEVSVFGPAGAPMATSHENGTAVEQLRCLGAVFEISVKSQFNWVIGASFLKNVYTVFDGGEERRIGFAELAEQYGKTESFPAMRDSSRSLLRSPQGFWPLVLTLLPWFL